MHISHRLLAIAISLMILVPLATVSALTEADERYQMREELREAQEFVSGSHEDKADARASEERNKVIISESEVEMQRLAREKRALRLQLARALEHEKNLLEKGIDPGDTEAVIEILEQEKDGMGLFLRSLHIAYASQSTTAIGTLLGQVLVSESLGERTEEAIRMRAVLKAREDLLALLRRAQGLPNAIDLLRDQHAEALEEYNVVLEKYEVAGERLHMSAASQEEINATVAEVQSQIYKMQSELARIDARLRRQAERALIEKGLMSPKEGEYSGGKIVGKAAQLTWPVVGRISAGFYNKSYRQFFGVDHKGIDIVVPQGTPVYAAADGVVFLSRPGGATGYSYVLIGHQGGRATLYGHLSQIHVSTGQDVYRGQVIGLSGGTPGTIGAGPMTTGAHLHFEVVDRGRHINPQNVLP